MDLNRRTLIAGAGALGVSALLPGRAVASRPRVEILPEDYFSVPAAGDALQIHRATTRFLSPAALKQSEDVYKTTCRAMNVKVGGGVLGDGDFDFADYEQRRVPAQLLSAYVPLSDDGLLNPDVVRRWSAMLNDLADTHVWDAGVLAPISAIRLYDHSDMLADLRRARFNQSAPNPTGRGALFTFIFCTSVKDHEEMNRIVGIDVANPEGELTADRLDFWEKFPWK